MLLYPIWKQNGKNAVSDILMASQSHLLQGPGELLVDAVSLFPAENVQDGAQNPWPFRRDLLDMLKAVNPRWVPF